MVIVSFHLLMEFIKSGRDLTLSRSLLPEPDMKQTLENPFLGILQSGKILWFVAKDFPKKLKDA